MSTDHRTLRDVRREQAAERRRLKEQRNRTKERLDKTLDRLGSTEAERIRRHNAVVTGMVPRIAGAVDSWAGKRVPMRVEHPASRFFAATDFKSIVLQIPGTENVDLDFAADLRGLAYHEAGHILKSVPFPTLLDAIMPLEPATGSITKRMDTLSKMTGLPQEHIHRAWNILEDQRMESAMVRESLNLGRYYNVIVLEHVLHAGVSGSSYLWLYGRNHVDATVRASARQAMIDDEGASKVQEAERLIDTYKQGTDALTLWEAVVRFGQLVGSCSDTGGLGDGAMDSHEIDQYAEPQPFDLSDSAEEGESDGQGQDGGDDEGDERGRGSRPSKGDADDEGDDEDEEDRQAGDVADRRADGVPDAPDPSTFGASSSANDPDWGRKLVREALQQAKDARNADGQVINDVKAYNHAFQDGRQGLPMERIPYTMDPDPQVTSDATRLNRSIRNLMEQARAEASPSWQTQQRAGVLDVRAYITRQPGDMEYYKSYAPGGDMKLPNMAVSVVLDGSGSMSRFDRELAVAAFGIKSACDVVGVPCTVTVYDTDAYLLWDTEDRPLDVPYNVVPNGGTDPKKALDLLDMQQHGKDNHLVIIMTDGQWSGNWHGVYSLAHYAAADRDLVLFYFRTSPPGPAGTETCSLVQQIDDLQEMPRFLQRYILRAM